MVHWQQFCKYITRKQIIIISAKILDQQVRKNVKNKVRIKKGSNINYEFFILRQNINSWFTKRRINFSCDTKNKKADLQSLVIKIVSKDLFGLRNFLPFICESNCSILGLRNKQYTKK